MDSEKSLRGVSTARRSGSLQESWVLLHITLLALPDDHVKWSW